MGDQEINKIYLLRQLLQREPRNLAPLALALLHC